MKAVRRTAEARLTNLQLKEKRICVTGGAGFLGSHVQEMLRGCGCTDIFVPRRKDYDLVQAGAVERLMADARPEVIIRSITPQDFRRPS